MEYFSCTRRVYFTCSVLITGGVQTPRNLWQWNFGHLWWTFSVVLVGTDKCCRGRLLLAPHAQDETQHRTHQSRQTLVHSCYDNRCHILHSQWWATVWSVPGRLGLQSWTGRHGDMTPIHHDLWITVITPEIYIQTLHVLNSYFHI